VVLIQSIVIFKQKKGGTY